MIKAGIQHYARPVYYHSVDSSQRSVLDVGVALISARKSKLTADAKDGNRNADTALKLQSEPDRFLSTIQIGITLIGILTGLFSGETTATDLGNYLAETGVEPKLALNLSKVVIVAAVQARLLRRR